MGRRVRAGCLLCAATLVLPVSARAQDEGATFLSGLNYGVMGGGMVPVGPQGKRLDRGPHIGATIYGETTLGFVFGVEGAVTASGDALRMRMTTLGTIVRLSPTPEDYRAYVELGGNLTYVSFHPDSPGLTRPKSVLRPGGSFAVGAEVLRFSKFALGGSVSYHGFVFHRREAVSYVAATLNLTFKPSQL